jgi:hypothetical protein
VLWSSEHCEVRCLARGWYSKAIATARSKRRSGGVPAEEIAGEIRLGLYLGHLCFLERSTLPPAEDLAAITVENAQSNRSGRHCNLRNGDDCARPIRSLNLEFGHN